MAGGHHWLSEFEQAPGVDDGQGSLVCCSPWGCKESDMTEWLNWTQHYRSVQSNCSVIAQSSSLWLHGLHSPWNSPGQNTGVGSLSLLQGIFPTQGSNPGLRHCRRILFQLSHRESPRTLEWVAYPFSSRSSWPRNQTGVSFIAGRFFTNWAIREAPKSNIKYPMGVNIFIYAENILYETYGERHKNNLKLDSKYVKLQYFPYILSYIK